MPRKSKTIANPDEIADKASRGEDVSAFFTNKLTVVRPVQQVLDAERGKRTAAKKRAG